MLPETTAPATTSRSALAYSAPMGVFLLATAIEEYLPAKWYPFAYVVKVCAVTLSLAIFRTPLSDIRPLGRLLVPSILVGLAVLIAWVGIDKIVPYPRLGSRIAFNPFRAISDAGARMAFLAVRLYGLAILVPVMEELFWRAFLLRYLTTIDFLSLPIEAFSWSAFWLVAAAFGVAHPEWLPAVLTAIAYGLLLRRTGSVFAAVVAHVTTNAGLGFYVLLTRNWVYW
jgi:uncharacterized protein